MPPVDFQVGGANRARSFVTPTAVPSGLEALAAGAGDFAEVFAQKAREDQEHRDRLRAVEHQGQYRRRITEGAADLDPTADDYLQQMEELHSSARADIMADPGISSRPVLEDLELSLTKLEQTGLLGAVATRHQKIEEKGLALIDQEADEFLAQIRDDPDGYDAYVTGLADTAQQVGPSLRPDVLEAKMRELGDKTIEAKVEGLAQARRYEDAQAFLKDAEGELEPGTVRFLGRRIREIQNTHQQDFHAATDGEIADVSIAIIDAGSQTELRALREDVETMASQGMFEGREQTRVSLIRAIESKHQAIIENNRDLATALQQYGSGTGNDSQKFADLAYGAISARYPEGLAPEEKDALDREFVKRSGFVPTPVKRLLENAERVENPEMLARAAQLDADIQAAAPGAETEAGMRSELTQAFNTIGLSWDEAAQLVIDRAPDNATVKARDEEFKEEFEDQDWREFLADAGLAGSEFDPGVTSVGGLLVPRLFSPAAEIPAGLVEEAEQVTRQFYKLSGDADAARAAAGKHLSKVYGVTGVGGQARTQKYPPERYLKVGDERDEALRTSAMDGLARRAIEATGAAVPDVEDGRSHMLVSDRQTQRDLEQGLLPSYEVRVRSKLDGDTMVPVNVETTAGTRIRLRVRVPDPETADDLPEVKAAREASKQKAMSAKERRQALRAVTFGVGQALETIAPDERTLRERHPFSGFLRRRNREK